jgi:hypothetical protein
VAFYTGDLVQTAHNVLVACAVVVDGCCIVTIVMLFAAGVNFVNRDAAAVVGATPAAAVNNRSSWQGSIITHRAPSS